MNGVHAAFEGSIGKDAEVRSPRDGKPWASFPVTDGEAPATWVRVALFGDAVAAAAPRLTKGAEVYCEGRLSRGTWTGRASPVTHSPYTHPKPGRVSPNTPFPIPLPDHPTTGRPARRNSVAKIR